MFHKTKMHRYVIVDVETTGLLPRRDRVIEIGAIALEGKTNVGEFHSFINTVKQIPRAATHVHRITNEMLNGQPGPKDVFHRFCTFVGDGILVAHNAVFDVGFLRYEFSRLGMGFNNQYCCTLEMSRAQFPRLRDHKLETVYRHLFKESAREVQRHRALDDARMVARVWMEMTRETVETI